MKELMRAQSKKVLFLALSLALGAGIYLITAGGAGASNQASAQNPYPSSRSTHWAWQNRPDLPGNLGEAMDWDKNAMSQGWPVSPYPRRLSVAVFKTGAFGHVAVVEQVFNDGSYVASETDEGECARQPAACDYVTRRTYAAGSATGFIHYRKDTRTTWGFAGGASGWTATNLTSGYSTANGWYYPFTSASARPQLTSPDLDISLAGYNAVEITTVIDAAGSDQSVSLFFATSAEPDMVQPRSATVKARADKQPHTYTLYLGSNRSWSGQLSGLRIELTPSGAPGGIRIDRVRLLHIEQDKSDPELTTPATQHVPGMRRELTCN